MPHTQTAPTSPSTSTDLAIISIRKQQTPVYKKPKKLPHPVTIESDDDDSREVISCYETSDTETEDEIQIENNHVDKEQENDQEEMIIDEIEREAQELLGANFVQQK